VDSVNNLAQRHLALRDIFACDRHPMLFNKQSMNSTTDSTSCAQSPRGCGFDHLGTPSEAHLEVAAPLAARLQGLVDLVKQILLPAPEVLLPRPTK